MSRHVHDVQCIEGPATLGTKFTCVPHEPRLLLVYIKKPTTSGSIYSIFKSAEFTFLPSQCQLPIVCPHRKSIRLSFVYLTWLMVPWWNHNQLLSCDVYYGQPSSPRPYLLQSTTLTQILQGSMFPPILPTGSGASSLVIHTSYVTEPLMAPGSVFA